MKLEFKKPAVDLTDLAIGIVVLGIVVSVGANILLSLQSNRLTSLDTYATVNETVNTTLFPDGVALANTWVSTVDNVYNATDGVPISSSNYALSVSDLDGTGTMTNTTNTYFFAWDVTYTSYNTTSRADYELAGDAAAGLAEYGNWFDIIVIVGIAAVILALIFMAFGRSGSSQGIGGSY